MFELSVAVDFPDDLMNAPFDKKMLLQMMDEFCRWGMKRVYWIDCLDYEMFKEWRGANINETLENLDNDILKAAVSAAHSRGLEIFAIIKPFEGGIVQDRIGQNKDVRLRQNWEMNPLYGIDVRSIDFVRKRPDLRMKARRTYDLKAVRKNIINKIEFIAGGDQPADITRECINIFVSKDNFGYQPYTGKFDFTDTIREDSESGKRVRVLKLEDLQIETPHVLFLIEDSKPFFKNRIKNLIRVYNTGNEELPITLGMKILNTKTFAETSVIFNHAPTAPTGCDRNFEYRLNNTDYPLAENGILGITLGTDPYVSGALCPAEPEVQEFWSNRVNRCLEKGVDGIDFRVANHNSPLDWSDYGFNKAVVDEYRKRYGVDIINEEFDRDKKSSLLGDYYTDFLRKAKKVINAAGKKMQLHIHPHMEKIDGYPHLMDIEWQWEKWIEEDLADFITLKNMGSPLNKDFKNKICSKTKTKNMPVYYSPYHSNAKTSHLSYELLKRYIRKARGEKDVDGYILYEAAALLDESKEYGVRPFFKDIKKILEQ